MIKNTVIFNDKIDLKKNYFSSKAYLRVQLQEIKIFRTDYEII